MNTRSPIKRLVIDGRPAVIIAEAAGAPASYGRGQSSSADRAWFESHPRSFSRTIGYHIQYTDTGELDTITRKDAKEYAA